jgi:acyl-CoA thioester hydrolase
MVQFFRLLVYTAGSHLIPFSAMSRIDLSSCLSAAIRIRVPFFDLDPAGVAWHGRYFQYFELARCELLERVGYSYEDMMESGILWPIADTSVRYLQPLELNQDVIVTAYLREWEMRIVIDYRISDDDGTLYTRASTTQVPVDADTRDLLLGSPDFFVENVHSLMREADLSRD